MNFKDNSKVQGYYRDTAPFCGLDEIHCASWWSHLCRLTCTSLLMLNLILIFKQRAHGLQLQKFSYSLAYSLQI